MRSHRGHSSRSRTPARGAPAAVRMGAGGPWPSPHSRALPLGRNCAPGDSRGQRLQELIVWPLRRSALPKRVDSIRTGTAAQHASFMLHEKEQPPDRARLGARGAARWSCRLLRKGREGVVATYRVTGTFKCPAARCQAPGLSLL